MEERKSDEKEVVDFYQVTPDSFVMIYREGDRLIYSPIEPELTDEEKRALDLIKKYIVRTLYFTPRDLKEKWAALEREVEEKVREALKVLDLKIDERAIRKLVYHTRKNYLGYGPIEVPMNDPFIEDISSTGSSSPVYVFHLKYEWLPTTIMFPDDDSYNAFIRKLAYRAGQELVYSNPIVEGPIPPKDYRTHLVLDVVSRKGSSFTIRRGAEVPLTITRLISLGTLSPKIAAYLWLLVSNMRTILIAGPMASGKTTLLNSIAMFIPTNKKVVTIEETNELKLERENWTPLIVRPSSSPGISNITLFDLLKSSLRQRPDYIIVGEIRGEEAYTFFQAISLGHGGLGTIHGESFNQIMKRLESHPLNVPRSMIPLVNSVVVMRAFRKEGGLIRRVQEVVDIASYDTSSDSISVTPAFRYDPSRDSWEEAEILPSMRKIADVTGIKESELREELSRRERFLSYLVARKIDQPLHIAKAMLEYSSNPEAAMEKYRPGGGEALERKQV